MRFLLLMADFTISAWVMAFQTCSVWRRLIYIGNWPSELPMGHSSRADAEVGVCVCVCSLAEPLTSEKFKLVPALQCSPSLLCSFMCIHASFSVCTFMSVWTAEHWSERLTPRRPAAVFLPILPPSCPPAPPIHSLYNRFRKHPHFSCGSLLQDCKHPTPSCPANALTKQIQILFASASGVNVYFRNLTSRRAQKCVHQKTDALISHCAEGIEKHIYTSWWRTHVPCWFSSDNFSFSSWNWHSQDIHCCDITSP